MGKELPLNLAEWNENHIATFIEENAAAFRLFAERYVDDREDVDDFLQEAYLRLWTRRERIGEVKSPRAYFFTVLRNVILDHWTELQRIGQQDGLDAYIDIASNENFLDRIIEAESAAFIAQAVRELPPRSREVVLHALRGDSMEKAAEAMHISVNTVKTLKYRALKQLAERLPKEELLLLLCLLG